MQTLRLTALIGCVLLGAACAQTPPPPAQSAPAPLVAPGSDRDAHGCIGSAGYAWCARTNQCERPWELAKKAEFELKKENFDAYCSAPAK